MNTVFVGHTSNISGAEKMLLAVVGEAVRSGAAVTVVPGKALSTLPSTNRY